MNELHLAADRVNKTSILIAADEGTNTICILFFHLVCTQMVPLIKKSSDVLVEKMGEFAESGKAVALLR